MTDNADISQDAACECHAKGRRARPKPSVRIRKRKHQDIEEADIADESQVIDITIGGGKK